MSATKWTKGPWFVVKHPADEWTIQTREEGAGLPIAGKYGDSPIANAAMLAAAPELYEALQMLLQAIPSKRDWLDPDVEKYAHLILRKARGEQQ